MRQMWPTKKLGEVCDIYQPKTISGKEILEYGPYKVYGANGVIGYYGKYNHEDAEVAVTCRGATCGTVNFTEPKSWITGNAMVVRPKVEELLTEFLYYFLKASDLSRTITGAAQPQITRRSLAPFPIPLPPFSEQKRIVGILEEADRLRMLRRQANDRMRDFLPALFLKMFGDPQTNLKNWPVKKFLEVCDFEGGTQPPKSQFVYVAQKGYIPFIQIRDFESDANPTFIPDGKKWKKCAKDNVLIARYGASLGRILRGKSGAYNVALVKIIPDRSLINNDFIFFFLQTGYFQEFLRKVSSRAAQAGFNKSNFANFDMILPPLDLQQKFFAIVQEAEAQVAAQTKATTRIHDLFQSLLHRVFKDVI